ncbi:MAG: carboxypeptidase-like regulatory domain-containing protein [archaeon]
MEDKWYKAIDKIDSKIPIYGIIDKIDSVIPSFALFLILIVFLILFLGTSIYFTFQPYNATFTITDFSGAVVNDSVINYSILDPNGNLLLATTQRTNENGELIISNLSNNQVVAFDINLSKGTYNESFEITSRETIETIKLKQKINFQPVTKTILFTGANNTAITGAINVELFCENPSVSPNPTNAVVTNGQLSVVEPVNCIKLYAKIKSDTYEEKQYNVNTITYQLVLQKKEPPTVELTINIKENNMPANGSFNIRLSGENTYSQLNSSASKKFSVIPGEYYLSISDPTRTFGSITKTITVNANKTEEISVSREIKATIYATIVDKLTGARIQDATVSVKDEAKKIIDNSQTDSNGIAMFALTTTGNLYISAKKVGGIGEGYFVKEIALNDLTTDANVTLQLEKITTNNAGKVSVTVTDQDDEAVSNAKIMLKYTDDTIVELNHATNYVLTDINGVATFLAGKVEGKVYAYANKYPFSGQSTTKTIELSGETEFEVTMEVGQTLIKINAVDEKGDKLEGEAQLFTLDNKEVSGIISIQNGVGQVTTKAGKNVYLVVKGENTKPYYFEPRFLWPSKTENYDAILQSEINEPKIVPDGKLQIYNETGQIVRTMKAGNKYYALLEVETDQQYDNVMLHFRAGKEELMENDFIELDNVEIAGNYSETRGTSYAPNRGYDFDSENLTDSLAKWITINLTNFTSGTHIAKINFRIKKDTPSNKELQFFWRASFDGDKKPISNKDQDLYDEVYSSNIYFQGEEAVCEESFCIMSEWLYDNEDKLYVDAPFVIRQSRNYTYHYQIINNSNTDYGENDKKIGLNLDLLSTNNQGAKITSLKITDPKGELNGNNTTSISDYELKSFERSTAVDVTLNLVGNNTGNSAIRTALKSDGRIIFSEEENFTVPSEEQLNVSLDKSFIPSLIDTSIVVSVSAKGEPLNEAMVSVYAKEPGFDEYLISEGLTNRLGKATIQTGAHFPNTQVIIEVGKADYQRLRVAINVSEQVVAFNPSNIGINLNTATKREEIIPVEVGNVTGKELEIYSVKMDADFKGTINEDALKAYLQSLRGEKIDAEGTSDIDLIRIRLANGLTEETLLEPINLAGTIIITLKAKDTSIIFDVLLPFNLNIGSGAQTASECLFIDNATQTKITERGQVTFRFELTNACQDEKTGIGVPISDIKASVAGELNGSAELSLQSYTSANGGRTALDELKRKVINKLNPSEKVLGTVTFIPNEYAVGKTINLPISIEGTYLGQKITTKPSALQFKADVINLKECIKIDSQRGAVEFTGESSVSVDATACLGQKIDIWLCKENVGCSGGAPQGKISLSKNKFPLQNTSETISVYATDLPGTYGVDVWARIAGKSSWSYIGETPVSFKETESKFFSLSKSEINIIGEGMQDTILLTNKMLDQTVKVKATNCIWGWKKPEVNWLQVIGGASLGAMVGNQIGAGIGGIGDSKDTALAGDRLKDAEKIDSTISNSKKDTTYYVYENKSGEVQISTSKYIGDGWANTGSITNIGTTPDGSANFKYEGLGWDTTGSANIVSRASVSGASNANRVTGWLWDKLAFWDISDTPSNPTTKKISSTPALTPYSNASPRGLTLEAKIGTSTYKPPTDPNAPDPNTGWTNGDIRSQPTIKKPKANFSAFNMDGIDWTPQISNGLKASFSAQGWGTVIGAIAGGLAAYFAQQASCSDSSQTVSFRDYVIFLQGETISVTTPTGTNQDRVVPSDALPIAMSLDNVSAVWDFTNADYSSEENVGIKFTNNGINNPRAAYATVTLNANVHKHGSAPVSLIDDSSDNDYDVICKDANFGQYWIGDTAEEGLCSGTSNPTTYSQQYHIRVISGEPQEEQAKITNAKTCSNGVLTGVTGPDAIPRLDYEWSWDKVSSDMCDYGNPDYVYCDGTQYLITMVKKLAALQEFFRLNPGANCPADPVLDQALSEFDEINSLTSIIPNGFIGVKDIQMNVEEDGFTTATVTVENNSTEDITGTTLSFIWKGAGQPDSGYEVIDIKAGETITQEFTATVPKWDDVYFFSAVTNGVGGNKLTVTRAFKNFPADMACWAQKTTRAVGGVPSITYYLIDDTALQWTSRIPDATTLYNYINHGVYLMRENFSDDLLKDFKDYYSTQAFQVIDNDEMSILEKLTSGKISVVKRFSNQTSFEAGLYDVWYNIDFLDDFDITNDEVPIESSLLLMRTPIADNPLYKMPFDGPLGEHGRTNYGTTYSNESENELGITSSLRTLSNANGNGVVNITTNVDTSFEKINSSLGTRGQLASITFDGVNASILFSPNYATPIIGRYTLNGTEGSFTFDVEKNYSSLTTGGNLSYWTGAARSRDFFGASAQEVFSNTPDSFIDDAYGFRWVDATDNGTIYLKTVFFTPTNSTYMLKTTNGAFWTPNNDFTTQVELTGIGGMTNNQDGDSFNTLQDLFDMVRNQDVCVSSDGSTTSFWWNPKIIANTSGSQGNLANQELTIAGN